MKKFPVLSIMLLGEITANPIKIELKERNEKMFNILVLILLFTNMSQITPTAEPSSFISPRSSSDWDMKLQQDIQFIKGNLKKGMSSEQFQQIMGVNFSEVLPGVGADVIRWRYDLSADADYKFEDKYDNIDIEGLKAKKLSAHLFIKFEDNNTLKNYSLLSLKKGRLFRMEVDGIENQEGNMTY
jgi:hypothetical protein